MEPTALEAMGLEESFLEIPLLGEERQVDTEHADSNLIPEDSHETVTANDGTANMEELDEPAQAESFWYRRRLEDYPGISRDDADVWSLSLFTKAIASFLEPVEVIEQTAPAMADENTCRHRGRLENHGDLICPRCTRSMIIVRTLPSNHTNGVIRVYPWIPQALTKLKKSKAFVLLIEWSLEWLALIFSISSFMAIVILLSTHNGQVLPGFVDQISINALVAIFSTVLRASVLFIATEGK